MGFIFVWIILAFLIGFFADTRGRSFIGFTLLSLVLSPLIVFIILLCLTDLVKDEKRQLEEMRRTREENKRHEDTIRAIMASREAGSDHLPERH